MKDTFLFVLICGMFAHRIILIFDFDVGLTLCEI